MIEQFSFDGIASFCCSDGSRGLCAVWIWSFASFYLLACIRCVWLLLRNFVLRRRIRSLGVLWSSHLVK